MSETLKKPVLETKHLGISFGGLHAVQDFNLSICSGELVGLIGPNGAGKTTVFNLLTGVYVPTEGTVLLDGVPLNGKRVHQFVEAGVARTFQNIRLFTDMTVIENVKVAFSKDLHYNLLDAMFRTPKFWKAEQEITEKALDLLEICGLREQADVAAASLPYGQQRQAGDRPRTGYQHEGAAAGRACCRYEPHRNRRAALLHQYHPGPVRHCHSADRA